MQNRHYKVELQWDDEDLEIHWFNGLQEAQLFVHEMAINKLVHDEPKIIRLWVM